MRSIGQGQWWGMVWEVYDRGSGGVWCGKYRTGAGVGYRVRSM